jgi:hypothetical protein
MTSKLTNRALALLIDPLWSEQQFRRRSSPRAEIRTLLQNGSPSDFRSAVNPLIDLAFIADAYLDGLDDLSALDVMVRYATDLMPRGLSPHPLVDRRIFEICHPGRDGIRRSIDRQAWVEALLNEPDRLERGILPFLDPAFVLKQAKLKVGDITARGARSISRFYLGVGARRGLLPHPLFDPVFVHAHRTGRLPSACDLNDPGSLLISELAEYLRQAGRQERASPSLGFDEDFTRRNRAVAKAIRERRYANAFHAYVAHTEQLDGWAITRTGIHLFPDVIAPKVWWRLDDAVPRNRGRVADPCAVFLRAAMRRLSRGLDLPALARIDGDLPSKVTVGQRLALCIHGFAVSPLARLRTVEIRVGRKSATGSFQGFPRPDIGSTAGTLFPTVDRAFCGFAVAWCGTALHAGPLRVAVRFRTGGRDAKTTRWFEAGTIGVAGPVARVYVGRAPHVSIAMATYNPKPNLLHAQIDSIRAQSMPDWQLVISDESTTPAALNRIRAIVGGDPRIRVIHGEHQGFVGNFERALGHLDRRSAFFALSDQDDVWYPQKLERLVEAIEAKKAALVYGGMRITSEHGRVLDESFFSWRQHHGDSMEELLLANTVTGAACMGRMSLMQHILPIPRYRSVYHDMWIALVASRAGGVARVAEPLQDYVQHGTNVLGQSALADRRMARLFGRQRRMFEEMKSTSLPASPKSRPSQQRLLLLLSVLWPELVQRDFLAFSLVARLTECVGRQSLSTGALTRRAAMRARQVTRNELRSFLNLPGWLEAGARCLSDDNLMRLGAGD